MGFGNGFTLKLQGSSFRKLMLQDMQAVSEGRLGTQYNSQLLQSKSNVFTDLTYITRNGKLVAAVGATIVGDTDIVGYPANFQVGGGN